MYLYIAIASPNIAILQLTSIINRVKWIEFAEIFSSDYNFFI